MLVIDEQQLIAWFGVGEAYPAGISRLPVIGYAARHMMFREFLVRHRKQLVEVVRWQSLDPKAHDHLLVLTEAILALQPRDTTRFLTRVFTKA